MESATRKGVFSMVIMNNNTATIRMSINSLAPFTPFVLEAILFKRPDEFSDRGVLEFIDHRETVIAGSSMSST